jgi:CBS domain-containing protein
MKLKNIAVLTDVMHQGMTLRDFFEEALHRNVPGLPYADSKGQIVGRISLRYVYKIIAVPDNLLNLADMIGDQPNMLDLQEIKVVEALAKPVEEFLLDKMPTVSPQSSIVKALTIMEDYNSSYLFLLDEGEYKGVITRMQVARRMMRCVKEHEKLNVSPQE